MNIQPLNPDDDQALRLLALSDAYIKSLYPPECTHLDGAEVLKQPNVLFVGAYKGTSLASCGAVKILTDDVTYGEIKRLFVAPEYRGEGISVAIMTHLENHLIKSGVDTVRLETGVKQPEALALYHKLGYAERRPFGAYPDDPLSVFMEKVLGAPSP